MSTPSMSSSSGIHVKYNYAALSPKPAVLHRVISHDELQDIRRLVVIGDVHGCLDELKDLLSKVDFDASAGDRALLVGDLVNKGPLSLETLRFARAHNLLCIRGNHDDFALCHAHRLVPAAEAEHLAYLKHLEPDDIQWLQDLPYSIKIPSWNALFVHAGLVPEVPLHEQSFEDLTLIRNLLVSNEDDNEDEAQAATSRWTGSSKTLEGEPWAQRWDGGAEGLHVYFGHDAKRGLQKHSFATGLDTGCAYGRQLTGIVLPHKEFVQVTARRVYQAVKED